VALIEAVDGTGNGMDLEHAALLADARDAVARTGELLTAHLEALKNLHAVLSLESAGAPAGRVAGSASPVLTPRQLEVLTYLADGLSTKQIAERLWLSGATVRNHVSAILAALEAHSRLEAVAQARRLGLL
jgi:DNA-binding NarL/FixJ family response regulator